MMNRAARAVVIGAFLLGQPRRRRVRSLGARTCAPRRPPRRTGRRPAGRRTSGRGEGGPEPRRRRAPQPLDGDVPADRPRRHRARSRRVPRPAVDVRVLLEPAPYQAETANQTAFARLAAAGADVRWSTSRFTYTHAKTLIVDHATLAVLTLNLTASGLGGNREYAAIDTDPVDVARGRDAVRGRPARRRGGQAGRPAGDLARVVAPDHPGPLRRRPADAGDRDGRARGRPGRRRAAGGAGARRGRHVGLARTSGGRARRVPRAGRRGGHRAGCRTARPFTARSSWPTGGASISGRRT